MLTSTWTVAFDLTWHFDHGLTLSIRATFGPYLVVPDASYTRNGPLRKDIVVMLINRMVSVYTMDWFQDATFWFWLPLCLIPLGGGIYVSGKNRPFGIILSLIGLVLVMVSPWTVPESDSSAGGHLLLTILGPSLLLIYGIYGMIFGGNVPVGRLDETARWSGFVAMFVSLGIFAMMHWWADFTPIWRGQVNPYWLVFLPTFLLFSTSLTSIASIGLVGYGSDRGPEATRLAILSVMFSGFVLFAMLFDGAHTSSEEFRGHLWMSVADIVGTTIGAIVAIGAFAIVIWSYERSLPDPKSTEPPTDDELKQLVELSENHIGGDDE